MKIHGLLSQVTQYGEYLITSQQHALDKVRREATVPPG
jgi:hypothetical protein